jgi:HEAT repeat protein
MFADSKLRVVAGALFVLSLLAVSAAAQSPDLEKLVAAANSTEETARLEAIHALGDQGPAAIPALVALLKAESPTVRGYAAQSLGKIGPEAKSAAQGLIDLLADPEPAVRRQAIQAIGAIRPGPKVSVPLFAKLMHDADAGVRLRVMETVAEAKGAAVPALNEALHNKDAAYWACVIIRDIGPDAIGTAPALIESLKDPNPEVRREATLALAAIQATDAVDAIVPLLNDEHAREAATFALAMLGKMPPEADKIVRANVKSKDEMLSAVSMWALARMHPEDKKLKSAVLTHLVALLKSKDQFARLAAARAMASLPADPEIALPVFEKALKEADEQTTHYMLDALSSMGPAGVPKLIGALEHPQLRAPVASILGRMGPAAAPATAALAKLLTDPDANVRIEAANALAGIGPGAKDAVPALIAALQETEGSPRAAAVLALGRIGPAARAADKALVAILRKSDGSLSLLSAWSLIEINGATSTAAGVVMPELLKGLSSPVPQARQSAAESLGMLGAFAKTAAPQLDKATKDSDPRVRDAAVKALAAVTK